MEHDRSVKGVLVFCGARCGSDPTFMAAGERLGTLIATSGRSLVYGGGTVGVMGALARSAAAVPGSKIEAIIPRAMQAREVSGDLIGNVVFTSTMSERKTLMLKLADTIICLPGGLGTLDELLEALVLFQLGALRVKIGLCNVEGFFDPFLAMLKGLVSSEFAEAKVMDYFVVGDSVEEVWAALEAMPAVPECCSALDWDA